MKLGDLYAVIKADSREFEMAVSNAERSMAHASENIKGHTDRIGGHFQSVGKSMQSAGKSMTKNITLPIAALGAAAFKMSMDFDKAMQKIVGLVGVAQDQIDDWRGDLMEMAPELGKSPKELAEGLYFVTSAGWRGAEAMELLEMSAKAAAAGLGETTSIAHLASSAMNVYGYETLNAEDAIDTLVATVREGKAAPEALASVMGKMLPVAAELEVGFDQLGAGIAAITRTGLTAGEAVTYLQGVLTRAVNPTGELEEGLAQLGMTMQDFKDDIADKGIQGALQTIREGAEEVEGLEIGDVFTDRQALTAALILTGDNAENVEGIFQRVAESTGDLEEAFSVAADTTSFKWNQAIIAGQAALTELGETVTGAVVPILEGLTEKIRSATEWWHNLEEGTKESIVRIAGFVAAAGPAILILGKFAFAIGSIVKGVGGLTVVIMISIPAVKALTAVMMKNPYVLIAAGIAYATYALIRFSRAQKEATELEKAHQRVQERVISETASQAAQVETLKKVVENGNVPLQRRKEALEELNRIVPEYNGQLSEEGELVRANTEALGSYIDSLRNQIRLKAQQEELTGFIEKEIEAEQKLLDSKTKLALAQEEYNRANKEYNEIKDDYDPYNISEGEREIIDAFEESRSALINQRNEVEELQKTYNNARQGIREFEHQLDQTNAIKYASQLKAAQEGTEEFAKTIKSLSDDELTDLETVLNQRLEAALVNMRNAYRSSGQETEDYKEEVENLKQALDALETTGIAVDDDTDLGSAEEAMKSLAQLDAEISREGEAMMDAKDKEEAAHHLARMNELEDQREELLESIEAMVGIGEASEENTKKIRTGEDAAKDLAKAFEAIEMRGGIIDDFDVLEAKIQKTEREIDSMIGQIAEGEADPEALDVLTEQLDELEEQAKEQELRKFLQGASEDMERLGQEALIMQGIGSDMDYNAQKARELEQILLQLGIRGKEGTEEWEHYRKELDRVREAMSFDEAVSDFEDNLDWMRQLAVSFDGRIKEDLLSVTDEFGDKFNELNELFAQGVDMTDERVQELIEKLKELGHEFESVRKSQEGMQAVAMQSAQMFGQAMSEIVSDSDKATSEIIGDMLRQVTAILIKEMVAKLGFPGGLILAATAPALAEGLFSSIGLKEGGVIPPGYSGDRYPAMLDTDEIVAPPKKLEVFLKGFGESILNKVMPPEATTTYEAPEVNIRDYSTTKLPDTTIEQGGYQEFSARKKQDKISVEVEGVLEGQDIRLSNQRATKRKERIE